MLLLLSMLALGCGGASTEAPRDHSHHVDHAHHRFDDAEAWAARFDDPSRDEWQKPEAVLDALELSPSSVVADIGSGSGYFAVRIARRVPEGRVLAVDVEPNMIAYLGERATREGITNIDNVLGAPDDPHLPRPADVAIVVDTYHHIDDRPAYFARLREEMTPNARLAIVDFTLGDHPVGPPDDAKIPPATVISELGAAGFRLLRQDDTTLPYQYVLLFVAE